MAVIISKTFTTAETMLNARTVRTWLTAQLGEGGSWLKRGGEVNRVTGGGKRAVNSCCCIRRDAGKYRRGWAYMHLGVPLCMVA